MIDTSSIKNKAIIYADGACSQGNGGGVGGWGAIINENGKEREIYGGSAPSTNNKMEMVACIEALKDLKEPSIVTIYTDSKYLINGITMWIRGWRRNGWKTKAGEDVKNRDLWEDLGALCNTHSVTWAWVRGHSGNRGNDIADRLAVKGKEEEKKKCQSLLKSKTFKLPAGEIGEKIMCRPMSFDEIMGSK